MRRGLAIALVVVALTAADAVAAPPLRVVVVPQLTLADLDELSRRGAVGLLVPDAGPKTSEQRAWAALVRGEVRHSLLGGTPSGRPLIHPERARKPPARGPAIVLSLPRGGPRPNNRRYAIAVVAPGYRGLLLSQSTRIDGLVSIVDVAPTALAGARRLRAREVAQPVETLGELDRRIRRKNDVRAWLGLAVTLLAAGAALVHRRAGALAFGAGLAANIALGAAGVSAHWGVFLAFGLATGGGTWLAVRLLPPAADGPALAGVIALYLAATAVSQTALSLSPLGPAQTGRFYGLSNLLATILLVPALGAAAVLAARAGVAGFASVAVPALVLVGASRLGADGGGLLVLAAGYALLAVLLFGVRGRRLGLAAAGAAGAVAALVALDAALGGSSHVTDALAGGPGELWDALARRVELSARRATSGAGAGGLLAASLAVLALAYLWTLRARLGRERRAVLLALGLALAVSLVVNDSPSEVAAAGAVAWLALARYPFGAGARR